MAQFVTLPRDQVYKLLEDRGLIMTDMRDADNAVWCNKKTGQYYTIPDHQSYPPSIVSDMLGHVCGENQDKITGLIDEHVFHVYHQTN